MSMMTIQFIGLVLAVYCVLYVCGKLQKSDKTYKRTRNWILIAASFGFMCYADVRFACVLLAVSLCAFVFAKYKKLWFIGVIMSIAGLCYFKYTNFFISSFGKLVGNDYGALKIILPLGISFYTFSAIGYIIDVKRGEIEPRSFEEVLTYITFFPKITSGPIQRSNDFFSQIDERKQLGISTFVPGMEIFFFGLFKKIVLADRLSVFVNQVYDMPNTFSSFTVFLAVVAYSFQIYFDFSGYSDMAIGVGKMLGIEMPKNFNLPYLAHNVTELWKRWHITLSTWLMKYLYISLGGNRKGKFRTYLNLILTMVIGGIWHGANWTYVIWGLLHGLALAAHKAWMELTGSAKKTHSAVSNVISITLTFLFTTFCWIFFRAESLPKALAVIGRIFSFKTGVFQPFLWLFITLIIYFVCVAVAVNKSRSNPEEKPKKLNFSFVNGFYPTLDLSKFWHLVVLFVFVGCIILFAYTGGSPFIYGNY